MADTVAAAQDELAHLIDVALDVVSRGENATLADWPDISTAIDALIAAVRAEQIAQIERLPRHEPDPFAPPPPPNRYIRKP